MSEEIKKNLEELAEVFPELPPFIQGRIIGAVETARAMQSRDQPEQEAG